MSGFEKYWETYPFRSLKPSKRTITKAGKYLKLFSINPFKFPLPFC
jgi:hypothetical protein